MSQAELGVAIRSLLEYREEGNARFVILQVWPRLLPARAGSAADTGQGTWGRSAAQSGGGGGVEGCWSLAVGVHRCAKRMDALAAADATRPAAGNGWKVGWVERCQLRAGCGILLTLWADPAPLLALVCCLAGGAGGAADTAQPARQLRGGRGRRQQRPAALASPATRRVGRHGGAEAARASAIPQRGQGGQRGSARHHTRRLTAPDCRQRQWGRRRHGRSRQPPLSYGMYVAWARKDVAAQAAPWHKSAAWCEGATGQRWGSPLLVVALVVALGRAAPAPCPGSNLHICTRAGCSCDETSRRCSSL